MSLEEMTKNELIQYAKDNKIYGFRKNDTKPKIKQQIEDELAKREWLAELSKEEVAIRLMNNIYSPRAGRLSKGIHLVNAEIAEELIYSLSSQVVVRLTPQEVAAYYGLDDGNTTE